MSDAFFQDDCSYRQKQTIVGSDGIRVTAHKCICSRSENAGQFVTDTICGPCPLKSVKVSGKPAPVIKITKSEAPAGTVKVEKDNDVMDRASLPTLSKTWPRCDDRFRYTIRKPCGRIKYIRKCDNKDSSKFGREVSEIDCRLCPLVSQIEGLQNGNVFNIAIEGKNV